MATSKSTSRKSAAASKAAPTSAPAAPVQAASPLPTPTTPTPAAAPAPTVALRGGAAVAKVVLTAKPYRTAAPHNQQWWKAITTAAAGGPANVAALVVSQSNPQGVPAHFIGYCLRRGYLAAA